jgi:fibronectin-binding autotransporter adhesin
VWGGAVGGVGSFGGNSNAGSTTYNLGGFAAGILTPELQVGLTLGYFSGTRWTQGFRGRSTSNAVQGGL